MIDREELITSLDGYIVFVFTFRLGWNGLTLRRMGFELFFGFLGVPEHDQLTSFFLDWVRALSGGLGTQCDTSGDSKSRSREGHFGYLWGVFWGTRFLTVVSSICVFFFDSADLEIVSLFTMF